MSASFFTKKCDQYGKIFDELLQAQKEEDLNVMKRVSETNNPEEEKTFEEKLSPGCKYAVDNFDIRQNVRDMTEEDQNKDYHWVNHNRVVNRVNDSHLSDKAPICSIHDLDNVTVMPNNIDHIFQREDYIYLVKRIITAEIPSLKKQYGDVVPAHKIHKHSRDMSKKTSKVNDHYYTLIDKH